MLLVALAAASCTHCAKISEPQPPELRIPQTVSDLAVRQRSDYIVITFSRPERNTNGSEATTLKRVDILRLMEDSRATAGGMPDGQQFINRALRIMSIPSSQFSAYLKNKTFVVEDRAFPDRAVMRSHAFRYAVLFVNDKNQSAGLSNQAAIAPVPLPPPPSELAVSGTETAIRLSWKPPAENTDGSTPPQIVGYNVYRSETPGAFPATPLNTEPIRIPEFEDRDFRFDTVYLYAVSTVGGPAAESLMSDAARFEARDIYPPAPPTDASAILQGNETILIWDQSPARDIAGYRIYRKEKGTDARQLVQPGLIRELSCRDAGIIPEKEYEYAIHAVDTHGNEGPAIKTEVEKR